MSIPPPYPRAHYPPKVFFGFDLFLFFVSALCSPSPHAHVFSTDVFTAPFPSTHVTHTSLFSWISGAAFVFWVSVKCILESWVLGAVCSPLFHCFVARIAHSHAVQQVYGIAPSCRHSAPCAAVSKLWWGLQKTAGENAHSQPVHPPLLEVTK
jgi:hypothetical protein